MKIKDLIVILIAVLLIYHWKDNILAYFNTPKKTQQIVEPIYTQDCFPRTLQQAGVTKKCFEHANFGQYYYCSVPERKMIEQYYKNGQDKDPLNDGSGKFCAD
jgi:hypothetical protein